MTIRTITNNDIEALANLFDAYRVFYRKASNVTDAKSFLSDRFTNNDSKIYVCENDDKELLGFVQLYPLFSSTRMKKYWLLNDLYVDTKYRGQGISVKLIERAKVLVKKSNACGMYLETEKNNVIGNKLYPKMGFELYADSNFYEWSVTD